MARLEIIFEDMDDRDFLQSTSMENLLKDNN